MALYILIQQLENNLIVPKVMERAVALHPLAVMVALLAGAELLGVTGAILSVPVAAAFSVVVQEVRRLQRRRDQQKAGLLEPGGAPAVVPEAREERGSPPDSSGGGPGGVSGAQSGRSMTQAQQATIAAVESTVTTIAPGQPPPVISQKAPKWVAMLNEPRRQATIHPA